MNLINNLIFADFETTKGMLSVWGFLTSWDNKFYYGTDLQSFIDDLKKLKNKNITVFFHNGSHFDFDFIIKGLENVNCFKNEKYTPKFNSKNKNIVSFLKNDCGDFMISTLRKEYNDNKLKYNQFSYLTNSTTVYEIKIGTNCRKENKDVQVIKMRCSALLFSRISLQDMGNMINLKKGDYDVKKIKLYKSKETIPNDLLKYLKMDCKILKIFILKQTKELNYCEWKLTAGSTAYNKWLSDSLSSFKMILKMRTKTICLNKKFTKLKVKNKIKLYSYNELSRNLIKQILPVDWLNGISTLCGDYKYWGKYLYQWYRGGLTTLNLKYKGKIINNINTYDINSSYPAVMKNEMLPYGKPKIGDGGKNYPLKMYEIYVENCVNKKGLPFVSQQIDGYTFYPQKINKGIFYLTSVEFKRFKKYYTYKLIKIKCVMSFKSILGDKLFGKYIDKYYKLKSKEKNIRKKFFYKIFLNSLYGKFGTKIIRKDKIWNHKEKIWETEKMLTKSNFYLPIAIFICAYARMKLIDAVDINYNNFYYCDTDCIHISKEKEYLFNFEKDNKKLGAWKLELNNVDCMYRRGKQYLVYKDNKYIKFVFATIHLKDLSIINFDKFYNGCVIKNQLRRKSGIWGLELNETDIEIPHIFSNIYAKDPKHY